MLYERNDMNFSRGRFRVRGDVVEVYPATADEEAVRIEFFGDEVDAITRFDPLTGHAREALSIITFFPAKQFVTPADKLNRALTTIRAELDDRIKVLESQNKLLEAQRLKCEPNTISRCCRRWGFAAGSRITRGTSVDDRPDQSPTPSSISSQKIF
jgi:excinuclease ABC subunit B